MAIKQTRWIFPRQERQDQVFGLTGAEGREKRLAELRYQGAVLGVALTREQRREIERDDKRVQRKHPVLSR